ncbi:hypothetical protein F2Q70_00036828 [Brassica cretica]|uniref:Uncharacterized protein n=1 Tax=Brassica cretica TaxID=69181 RepID=A0A8S9JQN1_BRACR|nr:hypothetical protein F2Q70_00036828 [Brassica cretica]
MVATEDRAEAPKYRSGMASQFSFRIEQYRGSWGGNWSIIASLSIHTHPSFSLPFCRTLSESVDGKKGNAPETHGTSNMTHEDVGKVDMCVLNPAPRNPGWKWGKGGCYSLRRHGARRPLAMTSSPQHHLARRVK